LVIDDGSTDGSQEIIQSYTKRDSRITFIQKEHWTKTRRGQGWVNEAMRWAVSRGCDYFSILDSDDLIESNYWESVLPFFSNSNIGFVRVGLWQFGEGETKWLRPKRWDHVGDILADNKVFVSSPFRIEMFKNVGDWDDNISWSDWDFWTRATIRMGWKWATCNEPLFWYRKHGAQLNAESRTTRQEELVNYMTEKYKNDLSTLPIVTKFGRHYDKGRQDKPEGYRPQGPGNDQGVEEPLFRRILQRGADH